MAARIAGEGMINGDPSGLMDVWKQKSSTRELPTQIFNNATLSNKQELQNQNKTEGCMELRQAKLQMIEAVTGGWDVAATFLGMSTNALRNRVYEVKDQKLSDEKSLALQALSKTSHYADAIAQASGGVFVRLPDGEFENEDLMMKFNQLYVLLGNFSRDFDGALRNDGVIDKQEEAILERDVIGIQKSASELLALMVRIYGINQSGDNHGAQ